LVLNQHLLVRGVVWQVDRCHLLLEDELDPISKCSIVSCSMLTMSIDDHRCLDVMIVKMMHKEKIEAHQEEPSRW